MANLNCEYTNNARRLLGENMHDEITKSRERKHVPHFPLEPLSLFKDTRKSFRATASSFIYEHSLSLLLAAAPHTFFSPIFTYTLVRLKFSL